MNSPTEKKRFPAWLGYLGWLGFTVLGVATVLIALRWYLIGTAHRTAVELVKQGRTLPPGFSQPAGENAPSPQPTAPRGKPVAEIPLLQAYLDSESPAGKELEKQFDEMSAFLAGVSKSRVDGVVSFRALLGKMGIDVPESMTEAEAAAEFLKQADKFSGLLARWKEAVAEGPWNYGSTGDRLVDATEIGKIATLAGRGQNLLGVRAEAYLRTGDADAAFADWQTLALSADRCGDRPSLITGMIGFVIKNQMFRTAHAGMQLGGWTDDQLGQMSGTVAHENALASMFRNVEQETNDITDYFTRFPEKRGGLAPLLDSGSPVDGIVNQIAFGLTTEQQMADNIALMRYEMERPFTLFDPNTGFYQAPPGGEVVAPKAPDSWFDKFYFMYSANIGNGLYTHLPTQIIKNQSGVDQTRIAAALELHQRSTGQYPESLEAVSGVFQGAIPRDIATGNPYFYQLNADGGYTLWGTGIDGKSEGGNEKTDVTWTHRPVKAK